MSLPWPKRAFVISRKHMLCYGPIPKVATNTFKAWMLDCEGIVYDSPSQSSLDHLQPRRYPDVNSDTLIEECYKFAFVRNPYERLVSAYVNQIVDQYPPYIPKYASMCSFAGVREWEGPTFREFINFIALQQPHEMDPHWMPQVCHLDGVEWDFIGHFEELPTAMDALAERTNVPFPERKRNRSIRTQIVTQGDMCVADARLCHLRGFKTCMKGYPASSDVFYTKSIREIVKSIYKKDFERFGYEQ